MRKNFDSNMLVKNAINRQGIKYYSIEEAPFKIYGVMREGDLYVRMPKEVAESVSTGIAQDYINCAGGRVRFVTDSSYIVVSASLSHIYQFASMSIVGTCGIDVYADGEFMGMVSPNPERPEKTEISGLVNLKEGSRIIEVNFPLYSSIREMVIGVEEGASLTEAPDYKYNSPIVYYGSSITNGACSSRPGCSYPARLSRMLDADYINLGFGGLCRGESQMAEYISGLDMSLFVLDYDYNAPTPDHLKQTHQRVYETVRRASPKLPIVMISAPKYTLNAQFEERKNIIKQTFYNAKAAGDENIYLICGDQFFSEIGYDFSADNTHPTDLGFYFMANKIYPIIKSALEDKK